MDDRLVFQAGSTIEDGTKAALQMLNESCNATAVQAVNDLVAIGCAETLLSQGLRIPEDISVVGFGNVMAAEYFRVPLTTIRQPKFRLGHGRDGHDDQFAARPAGGNASVCPPNSSNAKAPRRRKPSLAAAAPKVHPAP